MKPVEVSIPDWPYDSLNLILFAESAAAFEDLTLGGGLNELKCIPMRGRTSFASRASYQPSISCRRIASAARSPRKWRASFRRSICC